MLIAQALGEYGALSALTESLQAFGGYAEDLWREHGFTAVAVVVVFAVFWKIITAVK